MDEVHSKFIEPGASYRYMMHYMKYLPLSMRGWRLLIKMADENVSCDLDKIQVL